MKEIKYEKKVLNQEMHLYFYLVGIMCSLGEIWGKEYNWSLKTLGKPINHKLFLNETIKVLPSLQRWRRTIEVFAKVNANTYFI